MNLAMKDMGWGERGENNDPLILEHLEPSDAASLYSSMA